MKQLILVALAAAMPLLASAETCKYSTIHATTEQEQFIDNEDGTVTDIRTGLMWMKCSVGQSYSDDTGQCTGAPTHMSSWSDALQAADIEVAGHADWRVPNIKELQGIVERACTSPAIRLEVFPETPNAVFWSSTPDNQVNPDLSARVVDFSDGTEIVTSTNADLFVRLIRVPSLAN